MIKRITLGLLLLALAAAALASPDVPLGIRTNNPGNLVKTPIKWKGEVDCHSRFECFSSPEYGLRALAKNLLTYQDKYKLYTIPRIIRRWSPPHENRTRLLSDAMCRRLNHSCDSVYKFRSGDNLKNFINAIIIQENGYNPYPNYMLEDVIDGITNTSRNYNNGGWSRSWGPVEAVGDESRSSTEAGRIPVEDESNQIQSTARSARDNKQALPVDTSSYCIDSSILSPTASKISGSICTRDRSNSWMDSMESRIPVLRGERICGMESCEGTCDNTPRYPFVGPDRRFIFRWFLSGT